MPVQNKRGGTLKVLICRVCDKQFTRKKFQPVCCHDCNTIYKATQQTLSQADLQGASNNESTIEHPNSR
jgi:hypothetical protein